MESKPFKLVSPYKPTGDQPAAIAKILKGVEEGKKVQVILGATGTGKTFADANIIAALNRPTLVLVHNKTLASQLYGEFKELFPENRVEYFVSNFDFYQPEAYVPKTDTYIDKNAVMNDEIEMLRTSAVNSVLERRDIGIYKAVGFTSSKLRLSFAFRFSFVAMLGAVIGCVLSMLLTQKMMSLLLSSIGICYLEFEIGLLDVIIPMAVLIVGFFVFSLIASRKIKKVETKDSGKHDRDESFDCTEKDRMRFHYKRYCAFYTNDGINIISRSTNYYIRINF